MERPSARTIALLGWLALVISLAGPGRALAAPSILVLGDSLSAAYGIARESGWVALLAGRLRQKRWDYTVANASISGETTAGGAARIETLLEQTKPAIVIVALGANDGLRGLPLAQMKANLVAIVRAAKRRGARVLLVGMRIPPNYGREYARGFERVYAEVARAERVPRVPFLLEGIADRRDMFQEDDLHPNADAQPFLLDNVWKQLRPMLR